MIGGNVGDAVVMMDEEAATVVWMVLQRNCEKWLRICRFERKTKRGRRPLRPAKTPTTLETQKAQRTNFWLNAGNCHEDDAENVINRCYRASS